MDQRELDARVKALTKTIAANEPASNALSLLKTLKDEAAPTEEMLRVRNIPPSALVWVWLLPYTSAARAIALPHTASPRQSFRTTYTD